MAHEAAIEALKTRWSIVRQQIHVAQSDLTDVQVHRNDIVAELDRLTIEKDELAEAIVALGGGFSDEEAEPIQPGEFAG